MKIQLDTTQKTIKIEERVKISTLIDTLKKLLPNSEWKQFTLETNTTISYWTNPIVIREYPSYPRWDKLPWCFSGNTATAEYKAQGGAERSSMQLKPGIFNIEC